MGRIRVLLLTLAFLACVSPQTTHAEETAPGTGGTQHRLYFEGWLRTDADLPLYQSHDPSGMRVGLITSGHFVYTAPGSGPRFTGLVGISFSDHHVLFGLYGGGSFSEETVELGRLPLRGVVGWRMSALLPHHIDLSNETMFFVRPNISAGVLSQTELLSPAFGPRKLFAVGVKNLIEGNAENPLEDFKLLTGPQFSVWLLNSDTHHGNHEKTPPKVRADLVYKVGPYWNENRVDVAHELEAELLFYFGSN